MSLTQERLKELLEYNPETGTFIWLIPPKNNPRMLGKTAGSTSKRGYVQISIDNKLWFAHRLAFLYMEGRLPRECIDHIDVNPSNNIWSNLRECTSSENKLNRGAMSNSKLGIKGVSFRFGKYMAAVSHQGKRYIETFLTVEEATDWVKVKREELHGEFVNHG